MDILWDMTKWGTKNAACGQALRVAYQDNISYVIRVFLARAGADVVRIKGFLAISKCAFARALLAHFADFVTCALPKVASRVQNRCFASYLRPSVSALESFTFIL